MMLRKTMMALAATASLAMLTPGVAMARGGGGFGGGGAHIGGGSFGGGPGFGGAANGGVGIRSAAISSGSSGGRTAFAGNHNSGGWDRGRGGNWNGRHGWGGYGAGLALGGLYGSYAYYGDPYYGYNDAYYDNSYSDTYYDNAYQDDGGCYVTRQRVHTRHGWRVRPVQVCG